MYPESTVRRLVDTHRPRSLWARLLIGCIVLLFAAGLVAYLLGGTKRISTDSALFQHTGWYMTQGAIPYVDVWDINPPLTFLIAAALSVVAGGDMATLHVLSVALMTVVGAASVLLTGWLAFDVTGDDAAAVAAGLVVVLVPEVYGIPGYGLRSQFFALGFATVALVLIRRDRPGWAGASAAAGAGAWQPGGGVALLIVAIAVWRGGVRAALAVVAGGAAVTALVVAPFVAVGAFVPMVAEVVVAPFVGGAPYSFLERLYELLLAMGYGVVVLPVVLAGWVRAAVDRTDVWWIPTGGLLFSLVLVLINFNGSTDLFLWLVFAALGVALVVAAVPTEWRWRVVVGLVALVLIAPVWSVSPAAPLKQSVQAGYEQVEVDDTPALVEAKSSATPMWKIYWDQQTPSTCHYRLSWTELRWVEATPARLDDVKCGQWLPRQSDYV